SARSPRPPYELPQLAAMPPCRAQPFEPRAVEHVEPGAERALRLGVVGEPPRGTQAAAIRVDVLHPYALVEAVPRARAPEAGALDTAPRRLACRERIAEVIHPHHAGLDATCDAIRLRDVARPYARGEAELGVV